MINILIADVGGTNVRFQFFEHDLSNKKNKLIKMEKKLTINFDSFESAIELFLDKIEKKEKKNKIYASIAIAGPVENNKFIKAANLKWKATNSEILKKKFNFEECFLLNDFQAVGNSTIFLEENLKLMDLNSNTIKLNQGNLLIVGIGTGVGVCFVTKYINNRGLIREVINPSEFSHVSMCIKNYFDFIYNRFVRFILKIDDFDNLRMEIMFSGKGLLNIYNFCNFIKNFELGKEKFKNLLTCKFDIEYKEEPINFNQYKEVKITTEEIFEKFNQNDKIAELTMAYFMELLGNATYIFSSAYLPTRGTIFVGNFISSFGNLLEKKKNKKMYFDIFMQNISLEGHLKEQFKGFSYSFYMGDADNLGLYGSLNYLMKKTNFN